MHDNSTMQRNTTQPVHTRHSRLQHNTTQHNATQPDDTTNSRSKHNVTQPAQQHNTQLIATQHNATQPAQHDKTPDRYEIDGRAGRSTKNSTEKFGQKTLQV